MPSTAPEQSPAGPQTFAFTSVGANTNDSPQLNVPPPLNLGSRQATQSLGHRSEAQAAAAQPEYTQPGLTQTQSHPQQQGKHQLQQQAAGDGQASRALAQQMPLWQQQPEAPYQVVGQAMQHLPGQLLSQLTEQPAGQSNQQNSQQQQHLASVPVTVSPAEFQPSYRYPQLPAAAQLSTPQGNQAMYPHVSNAVITSGAMGPSAWSRPHSRSSSPALQPQVSRWLAVHFSEQ